MISVAAVSSCADGSHENDTLRQLDNLILEAYSTENWKRVDSMAHIMLKMADDENNLLYTGKALTHLAYFTPDASEAEAALKYGYLEKASAIADSLHNDTLMARVYNKLGVWVLGRRSAYYTAQYYFLRSLDMARKANNTQLRVAAELNLSEVSRIIGDTIGRKYDNDLFEYALRTDNPMLMLSAGLHSLQYEMESAADTMAFQPFISAMGHVEGYRTVKDFIYAQFYFRNGDYEKAETYALNADEFVEARLLRAQILNRLARYEESNELLRQTIVNDNDFSFGIITDVLPLYADNYAKLGDPATALKYLNRYKAFRDSADVLQRNDLVTRYTVEYEVGKKNELIADQEHKLSTMWLTLILTIALLLTVVIAYSLYIRHRNRLYRDIVRQNMEAVAKQTRLMDKIGRLEAEKLSPPIEESKKGVAPDKADSVYDRIQHQLDDLHVWRDPQMTRERFADLVECNRTYFSEIIRQKTGMNYSQLITSYRIDEAIRMLSDTTLKLTMKEIAEQLGFASVYTFHSSFRQRTGMSPGAYRKTAVDLAN